MLIRMFFLGILIIPILGYSQINLDTARGPESHEGYVQTTDGVQLFYRMVGSGADTVIVIHGGPGFTMNYFLKDLSPLARDRVLLFYDQRGTGRSTLVSDSASLNAQRFMEDLNAIREHFGFRQLTLLGHSWGAGVVALYASKHPDRVAKIIVVGVLPLRGHQLKEAFQKIAASRDTSTLRQLRELRDVRLANPEDKEACQAYYVLWFDKFFADPEVATQSKGDFCAGSTESRRNAMYGVGRYTVASLGDWDWREQLRMVSAPVLIIHGTLDPLPTEGARAWAAALSGSRLILLEGIGHFPYLEMPDRFFKEVDQFLRQR